ncbi:Phosphoribosylformylglycinamidine synthase subunit PurQ [Candidatus Magnetomoraceae bacterium gMMP-15]
MSEVNVLVLTGYGLNCDNETAYTFELAGACAHKVHINDLINGSVSLKDYQILVFGGGFSWGDDHGAGVIEALRIKSNVGNDILSFINNEKLVIGICNGFQTLVNMGLLPGITDYTSRTAALTFNDCGNFRDDWVKLKVNSNSPCVFIKNLDLMDFPVRHGEGKFYAEDDIIKHLIDNEQVVLQYADPDGQPANGTFPFNPNGSVYDIAGICDPTGRIFGLMPHPEAFNHWTNHPKWTRNKEKMKRSGKALNMGNGVGVDLFKSAVQYFKD